MRAYALVMHDGTVLRDIKDPDDVMLHRADLVIARDEDTGELIRWKDKHWTEECDSMSISQCEQRIMEHQGLVQWELDMRR